MLTTVYYNQQVMLWLYLIGLTLLWVQVGSGADLWLKKTDLSTIRIKVDTHPQFFMVTVQVLTVL